ncbi:MAG TPA: SDR family oxidoreductase [Ktedonobacteraceae bacterium]|nr:SDR family oxidoreductase [Ktedonobacteraceae bacterium]
MKEHTLKGKVALVTGAASGLGEATVRAFAEAGCMLACVDIQQEPVERVCASVRSQDVTAVACRCDVRDADAVFSTVRAIGEQFGHLDIVVNCAAVDFTYAVEEMTVEQWDTALHINLRAPFLFAKAAFPWMRQQHTGHIVNISSTAGVRAWANSSVYHATKWGIIGFSRGLSVEGREAGIRVTTIIPGGMRTHFFDRFQDQGIPMPDPEKLQDPATVAQSILYAVQVPVESAVQELLITPVDESSWP